MQKVPRAYSDLWFETNTSVERDGVKRDSGSQSSCLAVTISLRQAKILRVYTIIQGYKDKILRNC